MQKAQKYEKEGDYKNAMQLYKQLVFIERCQSASTDTQNIVKKEKSLIKKHINSVKNEKTNKTIQDILSSSYGLSPYKDNFLLPISYNRKKGEARTHGEAKFQLSIKKLINNDLFGLNESIYFAYTQTSWWEIYEESTPFRETNYKPEAFILFPFTSTIYEPLKAYKIAFLHASNGQGANNSRSWNRIYLEGYFQYDNLFMMTRIWYRIPESEENDDNSDILNYLGYGDLTFKYIYEDQVFKLLLRNNLKFSEQNKGYSEFSWSFPFFNSKDSFGYVQLSNGYGESLIDYNEHITRMSFGVSISR